MINSSRGELNHQVHNATTLRNLGLHDELGLSSVKETLLAWYDHNKRDLPWRGQSNPWGTWVSEIMLQQTRVSSVLEYFDRFMQRFPSPTSLAEADWDEISSMWAGLGYYSRARNLWEGAKQVVEYYGGEVPSSLDEIKSIKGVGPYTAGAICSIAFNQVAPIVDGNVMRVFSRLYMIESEMRSAEAQRIYWSLATDWATHDRPGDINQAIMELGATVCTPKTPSCLLCPVFSACKAANKADPLQFPVKSLAKTQKVRPTETWLALILSREREVSHGVDQADHFPIREREFALFRRPQKGLLGGQWALPMQSCDDSMTKPTTEEISTLLETYCVKPLDDTHRKKDLIKINHKFTHKDWLVWGAVFELGVSDEVDQDLESDLEWFSLTEIDGMALGGPSLKLMRAAGLKLTARRGSGR